MPDNKVNIDELPDIDETGNILNEKEISDLPDIDELPKKKTFAEPDYGGVSKIFAPKELTPQPTTGVLKSEELPSVTREPKEAMLEPYSAAEEITTIVKPPKGTAEAFDYEQSQRELSESQKWSEEAKGIEFEQRSSVYEDVRERSKLLIPRSQERLRLSQQKSKENISKVKNVVQKDMAHIDFNVDDYTMKSAEGYTVPDPDKIYDFAERKAEEKGLPKDGYYYRFLRDNAMAQVNYKIIEPDLIKERDKIFKEKHGKSIKEFADEDFNSNFKKREEIENSAKFQIDSLHKNLSDLQKSDIEILSQETKEGVFAQTELYKQNASQITDEAVAKQLYSEYLDGINNTEREYLDAQNAINTKYNARYRRQAKEIEDVANKKLSEEFKNYQIPQEIISDMQEASKSAYEKVRKNRDTVKELRDILGSKEDMYFRSTMNSLGGSIKGISTTMGFGSGEYVGDYLQNYYQPGVSEMTSWKDFLEGYKVVRSAGQLTGSMLPGVSVTLATTLATGGMGAPAAISLIASGMAGWATESADMAGRMYDETFSSTGDVGLALKRSKETWDSQMAISPAYITWGLPFMGKSIKLAKGLGKKMILGGVTEVGTEFLQEYPQNLFEEAIKQDKHFYEGLKNISLLGAERTLMNILPTAGFGAAGQISAHETEQERIRKEANTFAIKYDFNKIIPDQREQFIFDIVDKRGLEFSMAYVGSLYTQGIITKEIADKLVKAAGVSTEVIEKTKEYGFTPEQQQVFSAFKFKLIDLQEKSGKETDVILKQVADEQTKELETQLINFSTGKQADYVVVQYQNGEEYVLSMVQANKLLTEENKIKLFENGMFNVAGSGKGVDIVNDLRTKAEGRIKERKEAEKKQIVGEAGAEISEHIKKIADEIQAELDKQSPITMGEILTPAEKRYKEAQGITAEQILLGGMEIFPESTEEERGIISLVGKTPEQITQIQDAYSRGYDIRKISDIQKYFADKRNNTLQQRTRPLVPKIEQPTPPTAEAELQTEAQTKQKPKPDEGKETKVGEKAEGKEGVLTPAPAAVAEGVTEVAPAGEIKAEKPEYEFTSYDDAQKWIEERSKKYGGKNPFYASEEYKKAYPKIKELADIEKDKYGEKAKIAMEESAVAFGDKVFYDYVTPFAVEKYSGEIIKRDGIPYVKLDEGQKTMAGKKSVRWHKGWKKSKVVTKQATETTAPAGEIEILIDKIDKENKFVESLSKSKLESIEKVMNENQKYFEGKYDDSQNIYNVVTDRLKGEGIYEGNPVKDGEAKAEQPISPAGEKAPEGEKPKSILTQDTDLKGDEKDLFMLTPKEYVERSGVKELDNKGLAATIISVSYPNEIKMALYKGAGEIESPMRKAISEGRMTANDAKTIIESAKIEVPKDILEMAGKEKGQKPTKYTPEPTESELSIKEKKVREIKRRQVESDFKNQKGGLFRATNYPSRDAVDIHDLGLHYGTLKAAEERAEVRKKINPDVKIKEGELPKNPVSVSGDWGFKQYDQVSQNLLDDGIITKSEKEILDETKELKDVRQLLQKKGYDGIIYRNEIEDKGSISVIKFPLEKGQKPSKYTPEQTAQFEKENAEAKDLGFETGANEALGSINKAMREGRFKGAKEKYDSYAEIPKPELEKYAGERKVERGDEKKSVIEKINDLNKSIEELKRENPKEFKKDGTPKAKSKILPTYRALVDMKAGLIEEGQATMEEEFAAKSKEESEKSRLETEQINKAFEERQEELEKYTPDEYANMSAEEKAEEIRFDEVNRIFDKVKNEEIPTKKEIDYVNENAYLPKGFEFGKGGLQKKSEKQAPAETEAAKRQVKPSEPSQEKPTEQEVRQRIADRIRAKKSGGKGQTYSFVDFGLSKYIYDGALELVAKEVEKGTKLGNAINKAIQWIDARIEKGKQWNRGLFAKHLNTRFSATLPDGRKVEVEVDESREAAELINGFYSPLEQGILDAKVERTTGKEWLKKLQGVTEKDEMQFTGIEDFLNANADKSLTKKEVQDYLKNNRISIVEVVKGGIRADFEKNLKKVNDLGLEIEDYVDYILIKTQKGDKIKAKDFRESILLSEKEKLALNDYFISSGKSKMIGKDTKFSQYQMEGQKSGYKEVLIAMPNQDTFVKFGNEMNRKYGEGWQKENLTKAEQDKYLELRNSPAQQTFTSQHFIEPNILSHLRMNVRLDSEGKKTLFIEEIQSDWGQKGRKEGFVEKVDKNKISNVREDENVWVVKFEDGSFLDISKKYAKNSDEAKSLAIQSKKDRFVSADSKIPIAPFVTETSAWTKLALKTALKHAIKEGAERISWTTGEQQNERYDLSKQVDAIAYEKYNDTDAKIRGKKEGTYYISGKKDGKSIVHKDEVSENQLEDLVGKEVAQKIINNEGDKEVGKRKTLSGDNLKVGGKGMIGFYGSPKEGKLGIVGQVAESLFGRGSVKTTEIETGFKDELNFEVYEKGELFDAFRTKEQAEDFISGQKNKKDFKIKALGSNFSTQHSIDITPEIKASVEKGIPLFKGLTADDYINRGKDKLVKLAKGQTGKIYDITTIPLEVLDAITDIAIGYGMKAGATVKDFIAEARKIFGSQLKNVTDKELEEEFFDKAKEEKSTEREKELPEFKEHRTTGDKTKAGKYIVEKTEDGIKIFNADTGKTVKQSHQNQWAIEQYIKANIENFRSGKKAEISEGVSSEQIGNYIASESNNPAEIAETWLYSREGRDRTTMTFEEAVYDAAWDIDIDSFKEYYGLGKKDLGGSELKKRLKKDGIPLDMIAERVKGAMELSEEQAEFIESKKGKENELIERIIDFITSSEFESYKPSKETETEIALDSKFRDLTGLPLTESLANKITDYRSGIEKHIDEMKELRNKIPDIDAPFFLAPKLLKVGLDTYIKVLEETKNIRRAINTAIREIEKAALRLGEKFGVREKKDFIDHIRNKREEQKEAIKQAEKISRPATAKETGEAVKKIISQERTIEVEERELLKRHFQDLVKGERVGYKKGRAEERERAEVSEAVKKIRKDINEETKNLRKINQQIINESLGIETKTNAERRKEVLKKRHDVEIAIEQLKAKETAEAVAIEAEIIGQKKGRKEGAEAHREKVEIFTELLKEGKSKKFISERAFNYMLGKLGSAKTDLQFERLVELAERVLDKADYIEITTKLNIQRKKLKSRDYGTVQTIAKQFLSINPRHIPIDKLPLYEKMLDALAQKRVPSVKDLMTGYNEIYDSIIKPEPSSKIVNAKELQDNMKELTVRKINTLDEYLAARSEYKKLVGALEKLSKEGNISPEAFAEAQEFLLKTGKTIDEVAGENLIEQANKIKEQAIVDAKMMASETNFSEFTPEQRKEIEKFQSIPQDILMQMSIEDIDSYKKVMAEFDSGMINRTMYELINRANRIKGEKDIGEILSTAIDGYGYGATQATLSKRKVKFSEPKELLNDLVLLGKQYWDEYFGLGGQKPIFKKVVMPIVQKYNEMILEAKVLQSDFYKYSNKVSEVDRTKLKIILNQLDYQSNDIKIKGKPYTFDELPKDLRDYFKTITNPDNEYLGLRTISKSQLKMAQEAYKELIAKYSDADGNLDAQKALDGITKDAKIKNLFEARKNLLENLLKDKVRISTEKRGEQFEERENYEPRFVRQQRPNYGLYESAPETAAAAVEQLLGNPTPNMSLRGGATYGRTDDIYFLSFDLVSDTNNSIQNALRDYYLSDVVKEKLGSLASLMSKEKGDKQAMARELYNAMKDAIVTTFHLDNKTTNNDIKFLERLINSQRTYALAYPPRLFADFTANTLREISSSGGLSMDFRHEAYKDIIDNNYISLIFKAGKFAEERYITSQTMAQKIADAIIPLADTPLQRFSFVNAFKEQFKKLTKEEFNPDEYMKSESYRDKFQKQIEDAAFHAEAISSQRFNAQSPLVAPSKTKWVIWGNPKEKFHPFSQMLGFLQSWNTNDTANMKTKAKQFWSGSSTGRWDAFRDMTGIMASNYAYSTAAIFMGELIKNLAIEAIDDDEKEFVQHLEDMFVNATKNTFNLKGQGEIGAGTILQLMLGRYGNLFRLTYPALSGGIKYGLSDNPEALKKMKPVEDAVRKSAFVVPIQKGDRAENVLRTIPVFGEVALTGMDFGSSLTKITDKVIRDGFENLSEDEQELYTLGRSINAIVSMAYPNPISPTVKRALMASAKAAAKKEKENRMEFVGVEYLYQKTKNKELIPSIPKMSITEKGEEINLTYQQHSEFTQMVMDERKRKVMELKADTEFSMSDDNTKIKKIKSAYLSGYESAKEEFLKKIGAIESGLSPREEAIKKEKARRR